MHIQIDINQTLQKRRKPAQTIIVEWLDDKGEVLAVVMAKHEYRFQSYDNDREHSHFLEKVSCLESDTLCEMKRIYPQIYKKVNSSGRLVITDEKSEIVFYQK